MSKLKIAIQKNGRLSEKSLELLTKCGINFPNGNSKLINESTNFPIEILYLRDDDIPQYVEENVVDIGIIGENIFLESQKNIQKILSLGFASCKMSLAIPKEEEFETLSYFEGKKIATTYPVILKDFLAKNNIKSEIEIINGSVEIAPSIGLADGIFDIVSTGSTLLSNGLKEVHKVLDIQAILVANTQLNELKKRILDKLLFRINAVIQAKENKYILLNAPNEKIEAISKILPGINSPTIMPLLKSNWSSIHSVISEDKFWEIIDELKYAGAEGILVVPIEKMIQ